MLSVKFSIWVNRNAVLRSRDEILGYFWFSLQEAFIVYNILWPSWDEKSSAKSNITVIFETQWWFKVMMVSGRLCSSPESYNLHVICRWPLTLSTDGCGEIPPQCQHQCLSLALCGFMLLHHSYFIMMKTTRNRAAFILTQSPHNLSSQFLFILYPTVSPRVSLYFPLCLSLPLAHISQPPGVCRRM